MSILSTTYNDKRYKVCEGTYYSPDTPDEIIRELERARHYQHRIRIHYGDSETGRDWLEEHDVTGTVGRSMGPVKIPLMIASQRSSGGPGILTHCIVKIRLTTGVVLYQHPNYHHGEATTHAINLRVDGRSYKGEVRIDGKTHARFPTLEAAQRWVRKMALENFSLTV